jgi:hypothetical protein
MRRRRAVLSFALGLLIGLGASASAQLDCSDPDNLCTGDPCIVPTVLVGLPCVVDFGSRTVIVAGAVKTVSNGVLDWSAGAIVVDGSIRNLGGQPGVTLTATGDIDVNGLIKLNRESGPVTLDAGGAIRVNGPIQVNPGDVTLTAGGGDITVAKPIRSNARFVSFVDPRVITLTASGDIAVMAPIRTKFGDQINLVAGGTITVDKPVRGVKGGSTFIEQTFVLEAGGDILLRHMVGREEGTLTVTAGGTLMVGARLKAPECDVSLTGASVDVNHLIDTRDHDGGNVTVTSTVGDVTLRRSILADGFRRFGGDVSMLAESDLIVDDSISTKSLARGGAITLASATGTVTVNDNLIARGGPGVDFTTGLGGDIRLEAPAIQVAASATLDAGAPETAGSIRLSTTGNLALAGSFLAIGGSGPGGVIEAAAGADLTTSGDFRCAGTPDGCIALAAGGTLDTTGATFDKPPVADCPGSPSGAFLD